ncbi:MAG: hypothetical protein HZB39_16795 [Planctomycetes bacterium]|nr:hypothetical protein [Planctomycetota bacterium]
MRPIGCAIAAAAAYLIVEVVFAGRVGPALDDGWIYLAFARGFLEGDAFSYPGAEGPAAAITAPLWSFALALAMAIFGASAATAKALGVGVLIFATLAAGRLARAATGDARLAAFAALIIALSGRVVWASTSGMEAGLSTALASLGLALHLERRAASLPRWLVAAGVLALAGWSRPENFVFLVLAALHRRSVASLACAVALVATFPAFHQVVYGFPLPLPFYAKAVPGAPIEVLREQGLLAAGTAFVEHALRQSASTFALLAAMLPFLVPGLLAGLRRGMRARDGVPFVALALGAFVLARSALGAQTPSFQQGRYFVQLWPLFVVVALRGFDFGRRGGVVTLAVAGLAALGFFAEPALCAHLAFDRLDRAFPQDPSRLVRVLAWGPAAVFCAMAIAWGLRRDVVERGVPAPLRTAAALWLLASLAFGAARNGEGVRDTFAMNVAMAENVAREVPQGELVACHDLGALGWFARRPLVDLAGLATKDVAFAPRDASGVVDFVAMLERFRPRWLCLTDDMLAKLNPPGRLPLGLTGWAEIESARITSAVNVTVLGDVYRLIRIDWRE